MEKDRIKRWIEDDSVDPLIRNTITEACDEGPDAVSLQRITSGVIKSLDLTLPGNGGGTEGSATSGSIAHAAIKTSQSGLVKMITAVVGICGVTALISYQLIDYVTGDRSPSIKVQQLHSEPKTTTVSTPSESPLVPPQIEATEVETEVLRPRKPLLPNELKRSFESNSLEEIKLLRRAKQLLPSRPNETLEIAREHKRRFGEGSFGQEREALTIEALDKIGHRKQALRMLKRFKNRWPRSVYLRRLEEQLDIEQQADE